MLTTLIIALVILWVLGYTSLPGLSQLNMNLFTLNGHMVTLWEILMLIVIGWAIGILPQPIKSIASVILLVWILSVLGILAIGGLSNILILIIIVGLVVSAVT